MNKTEQKARLKELEALSLAEVAQIALDAELEVLKVTADKEQSETELNSGLAQTNEQLEKANDKIKELNDDLTQEKADRQAAEKAKEEAEKAKDEAEDLNTELNEELERVRQEKAADPNAIPEVEHQGVTYQVVIPQLRHKGQVVTAKVLEESPELVAELIAMESGMLQAKNKEA